MAKAGAREPVVDDLPAFLRGSSCGELIARRDWRGTSIGPVGDWPQPLVSVTGIMLLSQVPMVLLWGEEGIMIYNDAYSLFAGGRHPQLLGSEVRKGWPEVADFNDNVMKVGLAGGTLSYQDHELTLYRHGVPEQVWMNLDYSPVLDEAGEPAGVLCVLRETTQQVLAERHRAAERERLVNLYEQAPGVIAMLEGPEHVFVLSNKAHRELLGGRDVIGMTIREGQPELEGQGTYELLDRVYATGEPYRNASMPLMLPGPDGILEEHLLDLVMQPVFDAEGRTIGIFSQATDVTERARTEMRLRESEARFRALVDAVPSIVWFARPDGGLAYLNDRWYEFTGQAEEESLPDGWRSAVHPSDLPRTDADWAEAIRTGTPYRNECRYRRFDGAYRWHVTRAEPMHDETGKVVSWFGTSTDIHEQKQAIERLELALDSGGILGTWVWDIPVDRVTADERFLDTFGIDPAVAEGGFPVAMAVAAINPEDRLAVEQAIADAIAGDGGYRCEYRVADGAGGYRWIEASGRVEFADDGTPLRFPGVAVDITSRREAEERERLLAREVDHRAKNLLGVIQGVVQLTRGEDAAALKAAIVGRIHALSRAHSLLAASRWEGVELDVLMADELAPFARAGTERVRAGGPALRLRPGASQAIALAVHELATNAAKYGALSVEAGRVDVSWRLEPGASGENDIVIDWKESDGPTVQQPTHQGFGSTLLRSSIERQLDGRLRYDWKPDGLHCRIVIPARQISGGGASLFASTTALSAERLAGSIAGKRVLVVEDETLIALQIEHALTGEGCEVIGPAPTVEAAIALLRTGAPDLAILDVNLAGQRSDPVAEALNALQVPFVYCTGYTEFAENLSGREGERIAKPLDPRALAAALRRLVAAPRQVAVPEKARTSA